MKRLIAVLSIALVMVVSAIPVFAASDTDYVSPTAAPFTEPTTDDARTPQDNTGDNRTPVKPNTSPISPKTGDDRSSGISFYVATGLVFATAIGVAGIKYVSAKKH